MKDWKKDLSDFFKELEEVEKKKQDKKKKIEKEKSEVVPSFYFLKVIPVFKELKTELEKHGREVVLYPEEAEEAIDFETASISVAFKGKEEYSYAMRVEISQDRVSPCPYIYCKKYSVKSSIKDGSRISDISKEDIVQDFLGRYKLCLSGKI